jgi:hypothetical protein
LCEFAGRQRGVACLGRRADVYAHDISLWDDDDIVLPFL